ncbi:hypothetical protein KEJ27_09855 [Candidatus Bathyarchaeota archaeon]|nr:hypothetical protein [Candidatus Bathyarchaeota archaeon]
MSMAYKLRVNTKERDTAMLTKALLQKRLQHGFEVAMSTKNLLMLDIDIKNFEWAYGIASSLASYFNCKTLLIETPNGYHIIVLKRFEWSDLKLWIKYFITESERLYIDKAHLEASLRRGYITLRMNGIAFYEVYPYGGYRAIREGE